MAEQRHEGPQRAGGQWQGEAGAPVGHLKAKGMGVATDQQLGRWEQAEVRVAPSLCLAPGEHRGPSLQTGAHVRRDPQREMSPGAAILMQQSSHHLRCQHPT